MPLWPLCWRPASIRPHGDVHSCGGTFLAVLSRATARLAHCYSHRMAAIRTKGVMFVLCGMAALALWSGNEPVLPACWLEEGWWAVWRRMCIGRAGSEY